MGGRQALTSAWRVLVKGLTIASCAQKGYHYDPSTDDREPAAVANPTSPGLPAVPA